MDHQLSHASGEAYDHALSLDERKVMMQNYADYLDMAANGKIA